MISSDYMLLKVIRFLYLRKLEKKQGNPIMNKIIVSVIILGGYSNGLGLLEVWGRQVFLQ